jgi:hypothetical protein
VGGTCNQCGEMNFEYGFSGVTLRYVTLRYLTEINSMENVGVGGTIILK